MHIVDTQISRDLSSIHELLNEVILTSTALYDYHPRPLEQVRQWMIDKLEAGLPLRVAIDDHETLLGFTTFGAFRPHPAYKYTVEHSIYVHAHARGRGVGDKLLADIIECATYHDKHLMIGAIDADNAASIALHTKHGFTSAGTIEQAGFKFGRWLDLTLLRKRLPTPMEPRDG